MNLLQSNEKDSLLTIQAIVLIIFNTNTHFSTLHQQALLYKIKTINKIPTNKATRLWLKSLIPKINFNALKEMC